MKYVFGRRASKHVKKSVGPFCYHDQHIRFALFSHVQNLTARIARANDAFDVPWTIGYADVGKLRGLANVQQSQLRLSVTVGFNST